MVGTWVASLTGDNTFSFLGLQVYSVQFTCLMRGAALLAIGVGCAPVCPCLLHSTPQHFGKEHSQALVGLQVAASTLGNCILPSLFGLVAGHISIALLPVYIFICLGIMAAAHHRLSKVSAQA